MAEWMDWGQADRKVSIKKQLRRRRSEGGWKRRGRKHRGSNFLITTLAFVPIKGACLRLLNTPLSLFSVYSAHLHDSNEWVVEVHLLRSVYIRTRLNRPKKTTNTNSQYSNAFAYYAVVVQK